MSEDPLQALRDDAWVGDAVLALFARRWILDNEPGDNAERTEAFRNMTSNGFLSSSGEPTRVEAEIGRIYEKDGLEPAFAHIKETLLPVYLKQRANRRTARR